MKNKRLIITLQKLQTKNLDNDKPLIDSSRSDELFFQRPLELSTKKSCKNCEHHKEVINKMNVLHRKENQQNIFLLNFKDLALKKRDEMLYEYNKENLDLKAKIKKLEALLNKTNTKSKNSPILDDTIDDTDPLQKRVLTQRDLRKLPSFKLSSQQSFTQKFSTRTK